MSARTGWIKAVCACAALVPLSVLIGVGCSGDDSNATSPDAAADSETDASPDVGESGSPGDSAVDSTADSPFQGGPADRAGRPGVQAALIPAAVAEAYNEDDTFIFNLATPSALSSNSVAALLQGSLVSLDMLDGVNDWDGGSPDGSTVQVPVDAGPDADGGFNNVLVFTHPLVRVLSVDTLLVDSSKPFSKTGYLDIESNAFAGTPGAHTTCGGRWFEDDAVDKILSFVIKKTLTGVSDNVAKATKDPSTDFPYLADPN